MTKVKALGLLVALLAASMTVADEQEEIAAKDEEVQYVGEVVDVACYVVSDARGPDHAGCAKGCVKGGQPMGLLLDDDTLMLLSANHTDGRPYEALKDLAGERAKVTGRLLEHSGMKTLIVSDSEKAG